MVKTGTTTSIDRGSLGQESHCPILRGGAADRAVKDRVAQVMDFTPN